MASQFCSPRLLGLLFLAGSLALPATAQVEEADTDTLELEGGTVTLRVEEGKVYLNGKEIDEGTTVIVMGDDGERRVMRFAAPGRLQAFDVDNVWERAMPRAHVEVFRDRLRRHTPDELLFFYGVPGKKDRLHRDEEDREGGPLRWFDDHTAEELRFFYGLPDEDDFEVVLEAPGRIRDEEVMRLEREVKRLARELRRAEGEERERREEELRKKLEEIFERKMQLSQERLNELEEELKEAREQLEARRQARSEIIERRLRELLGERDLYEW